MLPETFFYPRVLPPTPLADPFFLFRGKFAWILCLDTLVRYNCTRDMFIVLIVLTLSTHFLKAKILTLPMMQIQCIII